MNDYDYTTPYFNGQYDSIKIFEKIGRFKIWLSGDATPEDYVDHIQIATGFDYCTLLELIKKLEKDSTFTFEHNLEMLERFKTMSYANQKIRLEIEHIPLPLNERSDVQLIADTRNPKAKSELERREWTRLTTEEQEVELEIEELKLKIQELIVQLPNHRRKHHRV